MSQGAEIETWPLTALELDVLRAAAEGLTIVATAERLDYSIAWVREMRGQAMRKLGARNVTAAVAIALRRRLL